MSPVPIIRRRGLLGLAALATLAPVLSACSSDESPDEPGPTNTPLPLPAAVAAEERQLVAVYAAVAAAFPDLAPGISTIGAQHQAHADALASIEADPADSASATPIAVPGTRSEVLAFLVASERRAMRERIDACVGADQPELARTLAFIAASEGAHIPALKDLRR